MTNNLRGKTLFITGASRGIGLAIAVRAARDGANVAVAAKTATPHPKLKGTIHTAADEIRRAGGHPLPLVCDVRDDESVRNAVAQTMETFGGIDVLVNNASAISLTGTLDTPMKRYDLMNAVNARATFFCSQTCLPHLLAAASAGRGPHILTLSPPLNLDPRWFRDHVAYTIAKYGMSLCVLGMAEEFRVKGVAVNALWPRTVIATSAVAQIPGASDQVAHMRNAEIVADAAYAILVRDPRTCTGNFFIDEDVLRSQGVSDFDRYAVAPGSPLMPDLFL